MKSARVRHLLRFLTLRSRGCVCLKPMNERIEAEIDFRPVVKLFTPDGAATWLLTEIDPAYQDIVFGLCDLGMGCPELGSVSLAEIAAIRGQFGLPVERDRHFKASKTISAYAVKARAHRPYR